MPGSNSSHTMLRRALWVSRMASGLTVVESLRSASRTSGAPALLRSICCQGMRTSILRFSLLTSELQGSVCAIDTVKGVDDDVCARGPTSPGSTCFLMLPRLIPRRPL